MPGPTDIHIDLDNREFQQALQIIEFTRRSLFLTGKAGTGKSTFLRSLNHLEKINSGKIWIEDKLLDDRINGVNQIKITPAERQAALLEMGMVFQRFNLFPHLTALENLMLAPVTVKKINRVDAEKNARQLLEKVGLADRASFKPTQLSGGQKQRVAIARAMVNSPKLLLADEPTGALDSKSGKQIMELFRQLNDEGVTVVMITHDRKVAEQADRIVYIIDGELSNDKQEVEQK